LTIARITLSPKFEHPAIIDFDFLMNSKRTLILQ
jgi:hypothetical protein